LFLFFVEARSAIDLDRPADDHGRMERTQVLRARPGQSRALWALGLALSSAAGLGCGPKPPIIVQETPKQAQAAETPDPGSDRLPIRKPVQIAGDPTEDPRPPEPRSNPCDFEPRLTSIGRGCERLSGTSATGTGAERAAVAAFDGDLCTTWSAGALAPQSATLDLGVPMLVSMIVLVPEMAPRRAQVRHSVETSDDGRNFQRLGELSLAMTSGEVVELPIPNGVKTRFIRVVTLESPAQVAWRDIAVLRCGRVR
jgi:hypothetical protein